MRAGRAAASGRSWQARDRGLTSQTTERQREGECREEERGGADGMSSEMLTRIGRPFHHCSLEDWIQCQAVLPQRLIGMQLSEGDEGVGADDVIVQPDREGRHEGRQSSRTRRSAAVRVCETDADSAEQSEWAAEPDGALISAHSCQDRWSAVAVSKVKQLISRCHALTHTAQRDRNPDAAAVVWSSSRLTSRAASRATSVLASWHRNVRQAQTAQSGQRDS